MINELEEWKKKKVKEHIEQIKNCPSVNEMIQEIIQIACEKSGHVMQPSELAKNV